MTKGKYQAVAKATADGFIAYVTYEGRTTSQGMKHYTSLARAITGAKKMLAAA